MKLGMVLKDADARKAISPLCDYDFALAHLVLEDKTYAQFYAEQGKKGRIVLLDNSMFETGISLAPVELVEACKAIEPTFVVCPDALGDVKAIWDGFKAMRDELPRRFIKTKLAVVIQGKSHEERCQLFESIAKHTSMLCFPFRENRLHWFETLTSSIPDYVKWPPYLHLMGVQGVEELVRWNSRLEAMRFPRHRVSVDTNKAVRIAYFNKMEHDAPLRGIPWPKDTKWTPEVEANAFYNVALLRRFL